MIGRPGYGGIDRLLHRIALDPRFRGIALQKSLAQVERDLIAGDDVPSRPAAPVFVTALPRAGTTLMLNLLSTAACFATHTYRDMPFVLAPLLWSRLSSPFRKFGTLHERAHGDGMTIGYDSPEGFEEIVWRAFWPEHYGANSIAPWTAQHRDREFEGFFVHHMRTVIATRAREREGSPPTRYLSKNNVNIARLPLLRALFGDCLIVVPLRDPASHCRSLLRQHRRFSKLHADEPFARQYMGWIGHFEFGADLRPIDFANGGDEFTRVEPDSIDFWLRYWISAYEAIVDDDVILVDQGRLRVDPAGTLYTLADLLDVDDPEVLTAGATSVRRRDEAANDPGFGDADPSLARRATALYESARNRCINR
jgi:hypothetical protein